MNGRALAVPVARRVDPRPDGTTEPEPCLHCGHPVGLRLMGCKAGHCPNCRHPYPHGDCSD